MPHHRHLRHDACRTGAAGCLPRLTLTQELSGVCVGATQIISCTANRTFSDSCLYEFETGSPLPSPASRTASLMVASWIAALVSLSQRENLWANSSPAPPWPFSFWLPFSPLSYQQHLCYMLLYHVFLQILVLPSVGRQEIPRMFLLPLLSLPCMKRGRIWQEQAITVKFSFCLSISVRTRFVII